MKPVYLIGYWLLALALISAILISMDYAFSQALLISLVFCPCALAVEYMMPRTKTLLDRIYLSLAVLTASILMLLIVHHLLWSPVMRTEVYQLIDLSPVLINPAFLGLLMTMLALGDVQWRKWLDRKYADKPRPITFISDRKAVTLDAENIAYIESNDTEVRVVTLDGQSYRNKTGISQWENLLGEGFVRIHRAYLVRRAAITSISADSLKIGDTSLPISRKYREEMKNIEIGE
jgi:hypothetical protein